MDCKILEIQAKDGLITAARYLCDLDSIATEGWWFFNEPQMNKPFEEVQETDVIDWVKQEAGYLIESNLKRQKEALQPKTVAPWLPQTFTPSI